MSQRSTLSFAYLPAAFWAALIVLVVNDHVLKGSGILPSVITGKLSDLAGLIVAPVLLCTMFSVRTDRIRGLIFGLVALGFGAIKLSPLLADAAGAALTALGIPSRIWCDPTDLAAFAVLPWAARLAQRVEPMPARWSRRFAIGVAALACVATSDAGPSGATFYGPFVINWTHGNVEVEISKRRTACDDPDAGGELSEAVEETVVLGPAQGVPIGWELDALDSGESSCGLADIRIGELTTRISWDRSASKAMPDELDVASWAEGETEIYWVNYDDDWAFERAVTLIGSVNAPVLELGELVHEEVAP